MSISSESPDRRPAGKHDTLAAALLVAIPAVVIALLCALLAFLLLLLPATAGAAETEAPVTTVIYKKAGDRELRLDIHKPAGWTAADRRPAIVFYHGGSWTGGSPGQLAPQSAYFATRGMVCISVQYRLLSGGDHKGSDLPTVCVADARSAFRWVRAHAAELGIDPARLAVGGASAGGYLAAQLALSPGGDDPADDHTVKLAPAAMILFNPVIGGRPAEIAAAQFEQRFRERQAEFLEGSPANHVTAAAPPTVIFHGDADTVIPPVQIRNFERSMRTAGVRCEIHFYAGQGHSFFNRGKADGRYFRETVTAADRFLASLGWLQGEPTLPMP